MLCFISSVLWIIFTDTHNTSPLVQSNRCSRCRTSGQCTAAKQGNVTHTILLPTERLIDHISQTLTTLYLDRNQIGAQGAKYLANALEKNTVTSFTLFCFVSNSSSIFFIDTHSTLPLPQQNRWSGCRTSDQCTEAEQSNIKYITLLSIQLCFHYLFIDDYITWLGL